MIFMSTASFSILVQNFQWIDGSTDDPQDLCAHGDVTVTVGERELSYSCCASAAALRMLKTLTEDHLIEPHGPQMLPCCGHFLIADKSLENVYIGGCDYGVDYAVVHQGDAVELTTEDGEKFLVDLGDYRRQVLAFAQQVEDFYNRCSPKVIPEDEFDRNGYLTFWKEWHRRVRAEEEKLRSLSRGQKEAPEA